MATTPHRLSGIRWEHHDGTVCKHRHTTRGVALEDCPGRRPAVRCSCGWEKTATSKAELESLKHSHRLHHR